MSPWDPAARVRTCGGYAARPHAGRVVTRGRAGVTLFGRAPTDCDCPPPSRVRTCGGRAARAGARQGRDRPTRFLMGDSPSPQATVHGPTGHNRCTPGIRPGLRRGRTRSGARSTASVFCAGVLCGSCVALRSPGHGARHLPARARSSRSAATGYRRGPVGRAQ